MYQPQELPLEIEYLIIGNVTQDVTPDGLVLGGTGAYSAITASQLGVQVGLVTRAASDLDLGSLLPDVRIHHVPDACTTTFENVYVGGKRIQWIRKIAQPLQREDVPPVWRDARIIHLAPIAQDVPRELAGVFADGVVGATPQGWLRAWDADGRVRYRPLADPAEALEHIEVLVFSPEDVASDWNAVERLAGAVPIAVVTRASKGCDVYVDTTVQHIPARPVSQAVDPTGAGDVFAAAFFIRYRETDDPYIAARFANCAASFSIEGRGLNAIPTRATIEAWMRQQ